MKIIGLMFAVVDQLADYFDIHDIHYTYQERPNENIIDINIANPHKLTVTYRGDQFDAWLIFKAEDTNQTFTIHVKEFIKLVIF